MAILIYCTTPDLRCAKKIASALVKKKLAACVGFQPGLTSVYRWKAKLETSREVLLTIKAPEGNFVKIQREIRSIHPYEVPEILSIRIDQGSKPYLKWIGQSCQSG
jgi:periplasmic divalent cation tolerance protein